MNLELVYVNKANFKGTKWYFSNASQINKVPIKCNEHKHLCTYEAR